MNQSKIEDHKNQKVENLIIAMGKLGLIGTLEEFYCWFRYFYKQNFPFDDFSKIFQNLIKEKFFVSHDSFSREYIYNQGLFFTREIEYVNPTSLDCSPIQFFRSRLVSYLKYHKVETGIAQDIVIAAVEALENAVKYSSKDEIYVKYSIENDTFFLEIKNYYRQPELEEDIKRGKYDSSLTLMRGMLVMSKLFDEMNIELDEEKQLVIFHAKKKIA